MNIILFRIDYVQRALTSFTLTFDKLTISNTVVTDSESSVSIDNSIISISNIDYLESVILITNSTVSGNMRKGKAIFDIDVQSFTSIRIVECVFTGNMGADSTSNTNIFKFASDISSASANLVLFDQSRF